MRSNTLDLAYRHLLYEESDKREEGLIKINGSITDRTGLINNRTRAYEKDDNGYIQYGHRWHIDGEINAGITKDTYFKSEFMKASDPNYMMVYHLKYETHSRNYAGIFKANQDGFHEAQMMRFDPLLNYFSSATTPTVMPYLRSVFEKKIDNIIGGRVIFANRYTDIRRDEGFSTKTYNNEIGYTLPIKKNGQYFEFFGSSKFDHYSQKFASFSSPNYGYLNNMDATTIEKRGNAVPLTDNRMIYSGLNQNGANADSSYYRNYYNISADYSKPIFTGAGKFGQFVIEPRLKYSQTPNNLNNNNLVVEDGLANELNYANLFSNKRSNGYDVVDTGKKTFYGVDMHGHFPWYGLNGMLTLGAFNYLGTRNDKYKTYYGMGDKNISDYVGIGKIYNQHFAISHEYRIDSQRDVSLASGIADPNVHVTTFSITNPLSGLNASISYSKTNLIQYGINGSIQTMSPDISYTTKGGLTIGASGTNVKSDTGGSSVAAKGGWLMKQYYILKQTNCIFYGVTATETNFAVAGSAQGMIFRINMGVKGL